MTAPAPIDDSLFFKLVRVVNLTARPFHESIGAERHLSLNEWRVMVVLAAHPGLSGSEVAALSGMDKMSVSRAIAALVRHKRVTRRADDGDKRRISLKLNAAGRKVFAEVAALGKHREAKLFSKLGASEKAQLAALVDKLVEGLEAGSAD